MDTKRPLLRCLYVVLLCTGLALASTSAVLAHGAVERTEPADGSVLDQAPATVQVWFDEALVMGSGQVTVINASGQAVHQGEARHDATDPHLLHVQLQPNLPNGTYIISAQGVVVSDGHTATGSTVFWIGEKTLAPDAPQASATPDYRLPFVVSGPVCPGEWRGAFGPGCAEPRRW
ncbi:MAG: copper resistance protein CopC [Anaerolineae bacterium]|nr:copper resistance protein CopC [Anaerolineae bacterium]